MPGAVAFWVHILTCGSFFLMAWHLHVGPLAAVRAKEFVLCSNYRPTYCLFLVHASPAQMRLLLTCWRA